MTRKEINAEIWLNTGIPQEICDRNPEIKTGQYGQYRKLDSGNYEFISYCAQVPDANGQLHPAVQNYISILTTEFKSFLDALLPPKASNE